MPRATRCWRRCAGRLAKWRRRALATPGLYFCAGRRGSRQRLDDDARLRLARRIAQAVKAGALPAAALGAHLRESAQAGEAFVTIDLRRRAGFRSAGCRRVSPAWKWRGATWRCAWRIFCAAKSRDLRRATSRPGRREPGCARAGGSSGAIGLKTEDIEQRRAVSRCRGVCGLADGIARDGDGAALALSHGRRAVRHPAAVAPGARRRTRSSWRAAAFRAATRRRPRCA